MPIETLREIGLTMTAIPDDLHVHRKLVRILGARRKTIETGRGIDWATAEHLAFGTLLSDGHRVRLSGEDVGRGTFSQRHAILIDQETEARYVPLAHLAPDQAPVEIVDSPLSEEGVLGFEYGYTLADPHTLVLWEAQFGDFANGAQVISTSSSPPARPSGCACRAWSAAAARLRGPGPGAQLGPAGALSAALRRRQHPGRFTPRPRPPTSMRCAARCAGRSASR